MTNPFNLPAHLIRNRAKNARKTLLKMNYNAGQGHTGADLSEMDILLSLYLNIMRYSPDQEDRDRFILSKGHGVGGFYACLAECGFVDEQQLDTFLQFESPLPGHPAKGKLPQFVEVNTGALGHGLSIAAGLALANKKHGRSGRVFVLLGDGELAEGSNWEALMAASKFQLNNLIVIVDRNTLQLAGSTEEIMPLEPLGKKAEFVIQQTNGVGKVGIIRGQIGTTPERDRDTGFNQALENATELEVVAKQASTAWMQDEGFAIAQDMLTPRHNGVFW